ncbi:kinase-like protein [Piromyces finnis]|uniref:non-specific serine/threonine protein kinase n=1 Tax=Piromyces finnis TaxID=1754191 RepID=A0A1Y1VA13_9FUNG|nr:kinase-like protein [Piromyces finnis]|eukprot:ORX50732.1 kinase-like protein [Piromyces finnis]
MLLSNIKNENTINTFRSSNSIVNKLVSDTLNSIPEAITICDKNGVILKINSKASRLFGWTDNELIEKKTFDILLTDSYRNQISNQLRIDPSSILDTTHFVYGLKKDGKTFPANILISNFSRDFLVKNKKTYLIIFSTSFIISQLKSNEPVKTKFFDGDNYAHLKRTQSLNLENNPLFNANPELNFLSNKGRNENNISLKKSNRQLENYETSFSNTKIKDKNINKKNESISNNKSFDENVSSWENDQIKDETSQSIFREKTMIYQDEEKYDEINGETPSKYLSSINSFKPSTSIPIKKEKIEVIPAYIPSSIQNFSFYISPLKQHFHNNEENYGESFSKTTYSRYQNEFEEITKLGKGGFGSVFQVRNKLDGQFYAIKKIKLQCDPKNTMECVMNSKFFDAPLSHTSLPKNGLPLSSDQDELNHIINKDSVTTHTKVKTFARISNHPNIVRYHGAWIEALEITDDSDSDSDEYNDSDLSSDQFDNENSIIKNNSSSENDSDNDSDYDNDNLNNFNKNDNIEIINESDNDTDNESNDNEFSQDITSDIDTSHISYLKENDDIEIVFEGKSHDIHIDIDNSITSQDELSFIHQGYEKINGTKNFSKLSQEIQQPKLELNDKTSATENEDSFVILFEEPKTNNDKSLSYVLNNSNSNSSITSEIINKKLKSNKISKKRKSARKNNSLLKHTLKKRNRNYSKYDNKNPSFKNINNLTTNNTNNNTNYFDTGGLSVINSIKKYRSINSPTLSVIEENYNSSSNCSDSTSILSNFYTKTIPSSITFNKDTESILNNTSKKEINPMKKEYILSSSFDENSRTRLIDKKKKNNISSSFFSTGINITESSLFFNESYKKNNFGTFDNPSIINKTTTTSEFTFHNSYQYSREQDHFSSVFDNTFQNTLTKSISYKEPYESSNKQNEVTTPDFYKKQKNEDSSKKLCSVLLIQMEFVSGKTLQAWLEERNTSFKPMIDRKIVIKIFKQIVQGLAHIHWNGFIHCDIKPANIFLQEDHHILIGDFGLAKKIVTDSSYFEQEDDELMGAGTYLYASPEQLSENRCYDNKTDIYSLGILLFEMLCPFSTGMERVKTLMDIRQGKFSDKFIKTWPREFLLIKSLLHPDPMERPTALEILDSDILLNSYPLSDTTDLLMALDLHILPGQSYNKNTIELNHFSSSLNKKYNYQNNSNLPPISSIRPSKNNVNDKKNNMNNNSYENMMINTRGINQSTSTTEINTVNASTYIDSKCIPCHEKDLMISSYKIRYKNSEDAVKGLKVIH